MADTRFTALGMSGSGKTCYILGMYYDMCVGRDGFTLVTDNDIAYKLERWMDIIDNRNSGMDRFPSGTPTTEMVDYSFKLCYHNRDIMSFDWSDYGGGTLHQREDNPEIFEKLKKAIEESTALYIFVDGEYLCADNPEERLNNVKRKCARTINSYIKKFYDAHNSQLPPIIFVVTKTDLCRHFVKNEEINYIIKQSFSAVFAPGVTAYVIGVSLGENISEDNYSGEVNPIDIHIPFFVGIFYESLKRLHYMEEIIENKIKSIDNNLCINKSLLNKEMDKHFWFFDTTDYGLVQRFKEKISVLLSNKQLYENKLLSYRKLLDFVKIELIRQEQKYSVYVNGVLQDKFPYYDF